MTHEELSEAYAERLVDDMDMGTLVQIVTEHLTNAFLEYEPDQLRGQIQYDGIYDDLLDEEENENV